MTQPLQPVNPDFNNWSCFIASQIFPLGFDVYPGAPNSMKELITCCRITKRLAIWSGDYTQSCFADSETWLNFRAWHDFIHQRYDCPFTLEGEHKACMIQAGQLMRLYGRGEDVRDVIALMFSEILSKLEHIVECGSPVKDGHAFVARVWKDWIPYAQNIIDNQGITDVDAINFAKNAYQFRDKFGPKVPQPK